MHTVSKPLFLTISGIQEVGNAVGVAVTGDVVYSEAGGGEMVQSKCFRQRSGSAYSPPVKRNRGPG